MLLKRVQLFGRIQSLAQILHRSDGTTMDSQFKEAHRHQSNCSGKGRLRWVKAIRFRHHSGVTSISQSLMVSINSHSEIAGS